MKEAPAKKTCCVHMLNIQPHNLKRKKNCNGTLPNGIYKIIEIITRIQDECKVAAELGDNVGEAEIANWRWPLKLGLTQFQVK